MNTKAMWWNMLSHQMIDELGDDHDKTVHKWMASLPIPLQVRKYIDLLSVKIEFHVYSIFI